MEVCRQESCRFTGSFTKLTVGQAACAIASAASLRWIVPPAGIASGSGPAYWVMTKLLDPQLALAAAVATEMVRLLTEIAVLFGFVRVRSIGTGRSPGARLLASPL